MGLLLLPAGRDIEGIEGDENVEQSGDFGECAPILEGTPGNQGRILAEAQEAGQEVRGPHHHLGRAPHHRQRIIEAHVELKSRAVQDAETEESEGAEEVDRRSTSAPGEGVTGAGHEQAGEAGNPWKQDAAFPFLR
jgi:hypothetical protein